MQVGDIIRLPEHLRDINQVKIGGLSAKVMSINKDLTKIKILATNRKTQIITP